MHYWWVALDWRCLPGFFLPFGTPLFSWFVWVVQRFFFAGRRFFAVLANGVRKPTVLFSSFSIIAMCGEVLFLFRPSMSVISNERLRRYFTAYRLLSVLAQEPLRSLGFPPNYIHVILHCALCLLGLVSWWIAERVPSVCFGRVFVGCWVINI